MGISGSKCAKPRAKVKDEVKPEETCKSAKPTQSPGQKLHSAVTDPSFKSARKYSQGRRRGKASLSKTGLLSSCCAAELNKVTPSVSTSHDRLYASQRPQLTPETVDFVLRSWVAIADKVDQVAKRAFSNFFIAFPEQRRYFSKFMEIFPETVWNRDVFLEHVSLVVPVMKNVVRCLEEKSCPVAILHEVGYLHRDAEVARASLVMVPPYLVESVKYYINQDYHWTAEMEDAWTQFFLFICHTISEKAAA